MGIKVLVVDDSPFMRKVISSLIERDTSFEIVGIARTGLEAIEKVKLLRPHVVTLDITMPEMDGLTALKRIMKECPTPVVMVSSLTDDGASATIEALEHGAVDCILKTNIANEKLDPQVHSHFISVLKSASSAKLSPSTSVITPSKPSTSKSLPTSKIQLLCIGSSTGGPAALQAILPQLPRNFPIPVIVAQHMPPGFTKPFADRFNNLCALTVKEAEDGELVKTGFIYICPSGFQTVVRQTPDGVILKIENNTKHKALYEPSVDVTLSSLTSVYKSALFSVILTGMGSDGAAGCKLLKKMGGHVAVESEDSCVVYGMPRSVFENGDADAKIHINEMFNYIKKMVAL